MRHFIKYIVLIIMVVVIHSESNGQDSLSYYLEQAALFNPGVKSRYIEYSAALERVPQASSLPDPELQLGYLLKPMQLLGGNQVANVSLMQMFPWFGTLKASKDEASKMALAKFESFLNAKNELLFDVKSSYYKVYRTLKEIEIAEKNLEILRTLEKLALTKFRTGGTGTSQGMGGQMPSGTNISASSSTGMNNISMSGQGNMGSGSMPSSPGSSAMSSAAGGMSGSMGSTGKDDMVNLLRVQIEIHDLENRMALLKDQLVTDKVSFNRFLNRPPSADVYTADSLSQTPVPANILGLTDSLANNPMVRMYQAESEANRAKYDMATKMGYPMLGVGLNYMLIQKRDGNTSMMNGKDMKMPMVSLSLPIFRRKYKAMRNEAELLRDAASQSENDVLNNLQVNFQQALQNLNDADRRVKLYTGQALLADKSVQLLITSYSSGGADFVEVLRMQQQLLDYQFKQVDAIVDKNTSIARVVYLTGN
jgi:outer membrane protein TolC